MSKSFMFALIAFIVVTVCIVIGSYIIMESRNEYVLFCIDKQGNRVTRSFIGFDREDINAIKVCQIMMFEPVDYFVVPVQGGDGGE